MKCPSPGTARGSSVPIRAITLRVAHVIAWCTLLVACSPESPAESIRATGVRAKDGDTVVVRLASGVETDVRLLSIDCPEQGQPLADKAREFSDAAVRGRPLVLVTGEDREDQYGRLLAFVDAGGVTLNMELARRGLAIAFIMPPNTNRADAILKAQRDAHDARAGMWSLEGSIEEPRSFRHRSRGSPGPLVRLNWSRQRITGNAKTRVAHWPGCRHTDEIASSNVRTFESLAEAVEAGYRMEKGYE